MLILKAFLKKGLKKSMIFTGIYCWDGKQGSGKSYSVADWIDRYRDNRTVITNQLGYYKKHKSFCIFENNIYTIIDKFNKGIYDSGYIIFYDELFSMVKKGGDLPDEIVNFISQLRKRHLVFLTTVQEWLDTNVSFRRYVKYSTSCHSRNIFGRAFARNVTISGYDIKWDNLQNEYVAPVLYTSIRKCKKEIADGYDTDEIIQIARKPGSGYVQRNAYKG